MTDADRRRYGCHTRSELAAGAEAAAERFDQRTVEAYLRNAGYWPRTDAYLGQGRPERGWYYHLAKPRGNPYLLDLLAWDYGGHVIEIELKTATGKLRQEQAAILAAGGNVHLCRGAQAAIEVLREWESGKRRAK
jgi:hypothetical protein